MISSEKAWQDVGVCDDVVYNIYIDRHRYRIIKVYKYIHMWIAYILYIYIYVVRWELCGKQQKMSWCAGASPRHRAQSLWGLEMRWTDPSSHANPYQPRTMAVSPWCTYPLEPVEPLSASTGFMWNKLQGCAVFCFSWFRRRFCKKLATQCHRMPKKEILCALNRVSLSHTFTFFPWNFCQERGLKSKLLSMCTEGLLPRLVSEMLHAVHWRSPNCRTLICWLTLFWTNMSAESVGIFGCAVLKFKLSESRYSWKAATL
jgi:hypothetical protein